VPHELSTDLLSTLSPFIPLPLIKGKGEDNYDMNLSSYHGALPLSTLLITILE